MISFPPRKSKSAKPLSVQTTADEATLGFWNDDDQTINAAFIDGNFAFLSCEKVQIAQSFTPIFIHCNHKLAAAEIYDSHPYDTISIVTANFRKSMARLLFA